eukprot:12383841-Alexandrium_andersonii.AAC.1
MNLQPAAHRGPMTLPTMRPASAHGPGEWPRASRGGGRRVPTRAVAQAGRCATRAPGGQRGGARKPTT